MSVTFTTNYKETLAPETLAKIVEWCEEGDLALDDALNFIDEHSEEDFREYYEAYIEVGEQYGYEAVDLFIKEVADVSDVERFPDAYFGEYSTPADFAEDYLQDEVDRLCYYIVVDWEKTSEYLLDHDFDRAGDHYFRCCY